jgi:hypothetical protein
MFEHLYRILYMKRWICCLKLGLRQGGAYDEPVPHETDKGFICWLETGYLRGVIKTVIMESKTKPMHTEAAKAGFCTSPWSKHPRLKLLTVSELLDAKIIDYHRAINVTFRAAPRAPGKTMQTLDLPSDHEDA